MTRRRTPTVDPRIGDDHGGIGQGPLILFAVGGLVAVLLIGGAGQSILTGERPLVTVSEAGSGRAAQAYGSAPAGGGERLGRRLVDGLVLTPRQVDGRTAGYVVSGETDPALLSKASLRPGDLLVDFDGQALDPSTIGAWKGELAVADRMEVGFMRDGQMRKRVIPLAG